MQTLHLFPGQSQNSNDWQAGKNCGTYPHYTKVFTDTLKKDLEEAKKDCKGGCDLDGGCINAVLIYPASTRKATCALHHAKGPNSCNEGVPQTVTSAAAADHHVFTKSNKIQLKIHIS